MRLGVVIPTVALAAAIVGAGLYALTGGFSRNKPSQAATSTSTLPTITTLPVPTFATAATEGSSTTSTSRATTTTLVRSTTTTAATTTVASTTTTAPATSTTTNTISPSQVKVEVYNGSGQSGQAIAVAAALRDLGFTIFGTANATTFDYTASKLTYAPGSLIAAETVAAHITGAYSLNTDTSLPAGQVDLVVGSDYAGIRS